eukprot:scaffold65701_cov20-Tisochrysis_lutea.AAC.1
MTRDLTSNPFYKGGHIREKDRDSGKSEAGGGGPGEEPLGGESRPVQAHETERSLCTLKLVRITYSAIRSNSATKTNRLQGEKLSEENKTTPNRRQNFRLKAEETLHASVKGKEDTLAQNSHKSPPQSKETEGL